LNPNASKETAQLLSKHELRRLTPDIPHRLGVATANLPLSEEQGDQTKNSMHADTKVISALK
jgi:hypothetical protein